MIRKIITKLGQAIILFCLIIGAMDAKAQFCTTDSSLTGTGVRPDTLPPACVGQYYEFSTTVRVPKDTTVQFQGQSINAEVCYIELDTLESIPSGLNVGCDSTLSDTCRYPGGAVRCALVSGTPNIADTGWHEIIISSSAEGCADDNVFGQQFNGCNDSNAPCRTLNIPDTIYIRVDQGGSVTAGVSNDTSICKGESVQLTATGGSQYQWSPTSGLSNPSVANPVASPSSNTTYKVIVSSSGCSSTISDTASVQVTVEDNPTISIPDTTSEGPLQYAAPSGFSSYQWSNGETGQTIQIDSSGTYSVTVTDNNGCTASDNATVQITTGIDAQSPIAQSMSVHPNPNQGVFTITLNANARAKGQLKVFNVHGQVLREENVTLEPGRKEMQMGLEERSSGLYYLQLKTGKGVINRKLVVQ